MLPTERLSCLAKELAGLYNISLECVHPRAMCPLQYSLFWPLTGLGYLYSEVYVLKRTTRLPRLVHPTVYASYHIGYGIPNALLSLEGIGYKNIFGVSVIPSSLLRLQLDFRGYTFNLRHPSGT